MKRFLLAFVIIALAIPAARAGSVSFGPTNQLTLNNDGSANFTSATLTMGIHTITLTGAGALTVDGTAIGAVVFPFTGPVYSPSSGGAPVEETPAQAAALLSGQTVPGNLSVGADLAASGSVFAITGLSTAEYVRAGYGIEWGYGYAASFLDGRVDGSFKFSDVGETRNVRLVVNSEGNASFRNGANSADATISFGSIQSAILNSSVGYTVSGLPTGHVGDRTYVTDAVAPSFLGTLTGGGTTVTPVFYNGTAWVAD